MGEDYVCVIKNKGEKIRNLKRGCFGKVKGKD